MPPNSLANYFGNKTKSSLQTGANSIKLVYFVFEIPFFSSWDTNYELFFSFEDIFSEINLEKAFAAPFSAN